MKKITIAIDGHSSCGKSTMAKDLAREAGYVYVDTGAMYRTCAVASIKRGIERIEDFPIQFRFCREKLDTGNMPFI